MSTDATSADKPVSSVGNTGTLTSSPVVDKGKGKGGDVGGEGEGEEDDDDEDEEVEEEDDDDDDDDDDELDEIDPSVIRSRRTRGIKVDYTSKEAMAKAGLKPDEGEEDGEDSFVHDDGAMKH